MMSRILRSLCSLFVFFLIVGTAAAQVQFYVAPPQRNSDLKYRTLYKPDETILVRAIELAGVRPPDYSAASRMKLGTSSGQYTQYSLTNESTGGRNFSFTPDEQGVATGLYFGIITTSSQNTRAGIQADASANFSQEFVVVVEADAAPKILGPQGAIENGTPVFEWEPVPGVPAYWLVVSSTKFEIEEDDNGDVSVKNANVVYQTITDQTSVLYGELNPDDPFPDVDAPPISAGQPYNFTVINVYGPDLSLASTTFGTITEFTYEAEEVIDPPALQAPANGVTISGDRTITFEWDAVDGANNYLFYLFERVKQSGTEIDVPVWNTSTTNTLIDFNASTNLARGSFAWYVIPASETGSGNKSETYTFDYTLPMAEYRMFTYDSVTGQSLFGATARIRSLDGGYSPTNPRYFGQGNNYLDSLVVGTYEFTVSADRYETFVSDPIALSEGLNANISFNLVPLPATVSGVVVRSSNSAPLTGMTVTVVNASTGVTQTLTTDGNGRFSANVQPGTYFIQATGAGYQSSDRVSITVAANGSAELSEPLRLVRDAITISGKTVNLSGSPVQLARVAVTSENGSTTFRATSDQNGNYSVVVSSGTWVVTAEKTGFISPDPEVLSLTPADNPTQYDPVLTERANQISGTAYEIVTLPGGATDRSVFAGVTVTATPLTGAQKTVVTDRQGRYSISLGPGTYELSASADGYQPNQDLDFDLTVSLGQTLSGIDFELAPNSGSIAGIVRQPDGTAVADARVSIEGIASTTTLPSGVFNLSVPPGSFELRVSATGYVSPEPLSVAVSPGSDVTGINFEIAPNAGTITGKTLSGGSAVSNVSLTATNGSATVSTTSNSLGNYTFNVRSGTWTIAASRSGFDTPASKTVTVGPGQTSASNNFNMVSAIANVSGTLTSTSGSAIRSASITITSTTNSTNTKSTLTRVDGGYAITVSSRQAYTIKAEADGYIAKTVSTGELTSGQQLTQNIVLQPAAAGLAGTVRDAAGLPVSRASITVSQSGSVVTTLEAEANGSFSIPLQPGTYSVSATKAGYTTAAIAVTLGPGEQRSGVSISVALNYATVSGLVTDAAGLAVPDVTVTLSSSKGGATVRSGTDGRYVAGQLVEGVYAVSFSKTGFSSVSQSDYSVVGGSSQTLNKQITRLQGEISGEVTLEGSSALSGVTVTAINQSTGRVYAAVTSSAGTYSLSGLSLASYNVSANLAEYTGGTVQSVTISPDATSGVANFSLEKNEAGISGTVLSSAGGAVGGVTVQVSGDLGSASVVAGSGARAGQYEIQGLVPGVYNVTVIADGYAFESIDPVTLVQGQTLNQSLTVVPNVGAITGRVVNQGGAALTIAATVVASDGINRYTARTSADGSYSISGLSNGSSYTLATEILREGYSVATGSVELPAGSTSATAENLVVTVSRSSISGAVTRSDGGSLSGFTMSLLTGGSIVTTTSTGTDGTYAFTFLEDGSYSILPSREGFVFGAARSVTLGVNDAESGINFTATPNVGDVSVTVNDGSSPVGGARVVLVNADNSIVYSSNTQLVGGNAIALFEDIKAGETYTGTVTAANYGSASIGAFSLSSGGSISRTVSLAANNYTITGTVNSSVGGVISGASVIATNSETGVSFSGNTAQNGTYSIEDMAAGSYAVTASASGFTTGQTSVTLGGSQTSVSVDPITLTPTQVTLAGRVMKGAEGVANVTITATGSVVKTTTTNSAGRFVLTAVPVSPVETDTTAYSVGISGTGIDPQSSTVFIPGSASGTTVQVPWFELPNGQISLTITDGVNPLAGANVTLTAPSGKSVTATTKEDGRFVSSASLTSGTYLASVAVAGRMRPSASLLQFVLETDDSQIDTEVALPYSVIPVTETEASSSTTVTVGITDGYNSSDSATLSYRLASSSAVTQVAMAADNGLFTATIPATFSEDDIVYSVTISRNGVLAYRSQEFSITQIAVGLLKTVAFAPTLNSRTLRIGDTYAVSLVMRDGSGASVVDSVLANGGEIQWTSTDDTAFDVTPVTAGNESVVTITPKATGDFALSARVSYRGSIVTRTAAVRVTTTELASLVVGAPATSILNSADGVQMSVTAKDANGLNVTLGGQLSWAVEPASAASISSTGFLTPTNPSYIGELTVTATDNASSDVTTVVLPVFARLEPGNAYSLTNGRGLTVDIPSGAVPFTLDIGLGRGQIGTPKRYIRTLENGSSVAYSVDDRIYRFRVSSSRSLPNNSLSQEGTITIPVSDNLDLFTGARSIGVYDPAMASWTSLSSSGSGSSVTSTAFGQIGEYAVLVKNEPLGIEHLSVLPNPFSPDVAPVKIGYLLNTQDPPASVSIKVFNIRGELVRTILDRDLQNPGVYGGNQSLQEITWDGTTDSGLEARNGRYLIQVRAVDNSGDVTELIPVVLVK